MQFWLHGSAWFSRQVVLFPRITGVVRTAARKSALQKWGEKCKANLPPKFAQSLAEFCVVQVRVLIGQLPPCSLSPDHERVHGSLDVWFIFAGAVDAHRHGHQRPVVALQHLGHGVSDAHGELLFLALLLVLCAQEEVVVGRPGVLSVRAGAGRARRARGVLRHAGAGSVGVTLLLFFCHLQVRVEEIHARKWKRSFLQ